MLKHQFQTLQFWMQKFSISAEPWLEPSLITQNPWDLKGPLGIILFKPCAQAVSYSKVQENCIQSSFEHLDGYLDFTCHSGPELQNSTVSFSNLLPFGYISEITTEKIIQHTQMHKLWTNLPLLVTEQCSFTTLVS